MKQTIIRLKNQNKPSERKDIRWGKNWYILKKREGTDDLSNTKRLERSWKRSVLFKAVLSRESRRDLFSRVCFGGRLLPSQTVSSNNNPEMMFNCQLKVNYTDNCTVLYCALPGLSYFVHYKALPIIKCTFIEWPVLKLFSYIGLIES